MRHVLASLCLAASLCACKKEVAPAGPPQPPVTTASGLTYQVLVPGTGDEAKPGQRVEVHYTGTLVDGTVFDSSRERGRPFSFRLGQGHVIKGWEEGIAGMKEGERRKLTIPPDLGYGSRSVGKIPENATLVFDVELLDAG